MGLLQALGSGIWSEKKGRTATFCGRPGLLYAFIFLPRSKCIGKWCMIITFKNYFVLLLKIRFPKSDKIRASANLNGLHWAVHEIKKDTGKSHVVVLSITEWCSEFTFI